MYPLAVLLALVGCTHRTSIRNAGREVGETATMRYPDGGDRRATFLGYVSTGIVVSEDGQQYTVPYEALESIEFTSHAGGAWQGVKWGAAVGAIKGKTTVYSTRIPD